MVINQHYGKQLRRICSLYGSIPSYAVLLLLLWYFYVYLFFMFVLCNSIWLSNLYFILHSTCFFTSDRHSRMKLSKGNLFGVQFTGRWLNLLLNCELCEHDWLVPNLLFVFKVLLVPKLYLKSFSMNWIEILRPG